MKDIFDFSRFKKVLVRDYYEYIHRFGIVMLIIMLLPSLIWLLCFAIDRNMEVSTVIRNIAICSVAQLATILAPSWLYGYINMKKDGPYFASYPATYFEKFLSILLYTVVVTPIVCLAGCFLMDTLLCLLPIGGYFEFLWQNSSMYNEYITYTNTNTNIGNFILGIVSYSALMFFTTTIFKRHKILKTFGWIIIIGFAAIIIFFTLLPLIASAIANAFGTIENFDPEIFGEYFAERLSPLVENFYTIWSIIKTVVFYTWGYYRMKRIRF
ncbi:MAG: hypothetical protein IKY22_09090 [Bacteroidales bacterium]|nr:hypothetical protein [Bacteroidales bacterium]